LRLPPRGGTAASTAAAGAWHFGPLAAADGTIRATIVDAHLMFDADVTVPVRRGQIEFRDATVEHVGPDSRMGVSKLGVYVDAPNGRSYLYQFSSAPVAGVEYEQRGPLLGLLVTDRGRLQLQPFAEALLRQGPASAESGLTAQTRQLLARTSVAGDLRLDDGRFAVPGLQVEFAGRAEGRNAIRLHSEAVGRGVGAGIDALSLRSAAIEAGNWQLQCDGITGTLDLSLSADGVDLRFAFELASMEITGLSLPSAGPSSAQEPDAGTAPRGAVPETR
jgi:hypothetical protein